MSPETCIKQISHLNAVLPPLCASGSMQTSNMMSSCACDFMHAPERVRCKSDMDAERLGQQEGLHVYDATGAASRCKGCHCALHISYAASAKVQDYISNVSCMHKQCLIRAPRTLSFAVWLQAERSWTAAFGQSECRTQNRQHSVAMSGRPHPFDRTQAASFLLACLQGLLAYLHHGRNQLPTGCKGDF